MNSILIATLNWLFWGVAGLYFAEMSEETLLAVLLNKRASSTGTSGSAMAQAFERIAKANGGVVTFDAASGVNAKYPSDLAFYFRQAGGKCVTSKARNGNSFWTVNKLPNGKFAYIAEVRELIAETQAKIAAKQSKQTPAAK